MRKDVRPSVNVVNIVNVLHMMGLAADWIGSAAYPRSVRWVDFVSLHEGVDTSKPKWTSAVQHFRLHRRVRARVDPQRLGCRA